MRTLIRRLRLELELREAALSVVFRATRFLATFDADFLCERFLLGFLVVLRAAMLPPMRLCVALQTARDPLRYRRSSCCEWMNPPEPCGIPAEWRYVLHARHAFGQHTGSDSVPDR